MVVLSKIVFIDVKSVIVSQTYGGRLKVVGIQNNKRITLLYVAGLQVE